MRVLFLGGVFPKDIEEKIYTNSRGIVQSAANTLQWHIINGLEVNLGKELTIISSAFVGCYPDLYTKIIFEKHRFCHKGNAEDIAISFVNLKGIEIYHRMIKLYKPVKKWLSKSCDECGDKTVFVYSAQAQFLNVVKKIKKDFPDTHICLIVPDLPEYMTVTAKKNLVRLIYEKFMKANLEKCIYENMKYVDSFVVLTQQMREPLGIGHRPYVVVEGIADDCQAILEPVAHDVPVKIIMYTGTLARKYGVLELVCEFMRIKNEAYRLYICGEGDSREEIEMLSKKDGRIKYMGQLNPVQVQKLQQKATVLVNPRRNNEVYTRYSFPSKTMEYMHSGRPVLMFRLDGIPSEYNDYLIYFDQWPGKTMCEVIVEVCERPSEQLSEIGKKAREFVCKYKNARVQGKKILDMTSVKKDNRN